ncbi:hypothetical protein SacxiDRAFT_2678 [Saccharomonospora xinjiangensis XJ-54]|uniref:Antitoxin n=2 Tax=Saccharomonospora TaxID=1851 RepID=I0V445_9PSEU|nr:hypothetical protein SacxiDRAFT_2678 [Saccharomonospora xinjiangensis XJ-54]
MGDTLQIRNVPPELHAAVARHAREHGMTISQYLLRRISQLEGKPVIRDTLDDHWRRTSAYERIAPGTAAELLSEDRDR